MTPVRPRSRDGPGGLPRPRTTFVGRADELAAARELLGHTRLLTCTGPGGAGKTRLAIALAAQVADGFPDGVHFASLAALRDRGSCRTPSRTAWVCRTPPAGRSSST